MMLQYGKVVTEEGYKNGNVVTTVRRVSESIPLANRQELVERIFSQLEQLNEYDSVSFTIHADKRTRQPYRIEVMSEAKL